MRQFCAEAKIVWLLTFPNRFAPLKTFASLKYGGYTIQHIHGFKVELYHWPLVWHHSDGTSADFERIFLKPLFLLSYS